MLISSTVGIELAGKSLRIAVLQSRFGKLRLLDSQEIPEFLDLSEEQRAATVSKIVKERGLALGRAFLTISRDRGMVRQLEFPIEVLDKLKSAVTLQIESLCPWPAGEIYWDYSYGPLKKGVKAFRVTVAMVPRQELDHWFEFFKSVQLPLSGALLSSVAHAHCVQALWPEPPATIVLDCESDYVEAMLLHAGQLTGITSFDADTAVAAKTATEKLISVGRVADPSAVSCISFGSTQESLAAAEATTLPIENAAASGSRFFGAIASSLAGLRTTAFGLNLIPASLRYRRSQWETVPTYVLVALALLLGAAMIVREPYQTAVYASQIDQEISRVAPVARVVAKQQSELNQLSEQYRALAASLQNRDYNLEILQELQRILPNGAWLTSYTYQDGNIQLTGYADSAAEIQKLLANSPLLKDVQATAAVVRDPKGKDKFTLKASVVTR